MTREAYIAKSAYIDDPGCIAEAFLAGCMGGHCGSIGSLHIFAYLIAFHFDILRCRNSMWLAEEL